MDLFQQFKNLEITRDQYQSIRGGVQIDGQTEIGAGSSEWKCYGTYYSYVADDADDAIAWCDNPSNACIYCEPVGQ